MAINFNYGSIHQGYQPEGGGDTLELMNVALEAANLAFANYDYKDEFTNMLAPYIERYEGDNGMKITEETHNALFEDYGDQSAPMSYNPDYSEWTLYSEKYQGKNYGFTVDYWRGLEESGKNPERGLLRRTEAIISNYENRFLPNILLQAIYDVPDSGGEYTDNFGALRGTEIPEMMLVDYDDTAADGTINSNVRDHFRVVADTDGVTDKDFKFVGNYFNAYNDVDTSNVLAIMNKGTRADLSSIFADTMNEDLFNSELGSKRFSIMGFDALEVKDCVDDMIIFINMEPGKNLIGELVSPDPSYRGITLQSVNSMNTAFEKPKDLVENGGTKFVIERIGEHWMGRHRLLFLDLDADNFSADRIMPEAGLNRIKNKAIRLKRQWKRLKK